MRKQMKVYYAAVYQHTNGQYLTKWSVTELDLEEMERSPFVVEVWEFETKEEYDKFISGVRERRGPEDPKFVEEETRFCFVCGKPVETRTQDGADWSWFGDVDEGDGRPHSESIHKSCAEKRKIYRIEKKSRGGSKK